MHERAEEEAMDHSYDKLDMSMDGEVQLEVTNEVRGWTFYGGKGDDEEVFTPCA